MKINYREFDYRMLSQLKNDCEYFIHQSGGCLKYLYNCNVKDHIDKMKKIYNSFSKNQRPQWISMGDILRYEQQMAV